MAALHLPFRALLGALAVFASACTGDGRQTDLDPDPSDSGPTSPDAAPPEICDGLDNNGDGQIDEGVANLCGGCGEVPPEGCQAWRIDLVQESDGLVDLQRIVGMSGKLLEAHEREIDGARCQQIRAPIVLPGDDIGPVMLETPQRHLELIPTFDERVSLHRYADPNAPARAHLFDGGDPIRASGQGGSALGPFELTAAGPPPWTSVDMADLEAIAALKQGGGPGAEDPVAARLTWAPAPTDGANGAVRLFIGGSRQVFNHTVYRAIEHYQLDASLVDDGALLLEPGQLGATLPESAIWVRLSRRVNAHRVLGAHSVTLSASQTLNHRASGNLDRDEPPPFELLTPSVSHRRIDPGQALVVRWTKLPKATGPLRVSLSLFDEPSGALQRYTCVVDDPSRGELTLPAELTQQWTAGETNRAQLDLRWTSSTHSLPPPDVGTMEHAISLLLRLE